MNDPGDKWQALLNQMASDEPVDWDTQDIHNESENEILQQLKRIHDIQQVFASHHQVYQQPSQNAVVALFEWGHLQVIEQLGEGGYGDVYRAFDPVLNRDVALKLLKPDQLAGFHSKLFIEEAQRIAQVRNRHVLAIHGAGVHDGQVGFWSDLILGKTLEGHTRVELEELLSAGVALSQALKAVHEAGLVHGDVKAANVMLDQNDQYVLMDFGAGLESGSNHPSNHSVGSPMLMAPELFADSPKSPASDIYAMGCLLFKMASGQYPVKGENILDIAQAHQNSAYLSLRSFRPDMPTSMLRLIQAMINPHPQSRPTASVIIKALELVREEPVQRKKRRMVMGIIGSLLFGLVLASSGLYFANVERQKAVQEQQKAEAVNEFLQEILGSTFDVGKGREVRVADMLDLAAKNSTDRFAAQPLALAAISEAIGKSYQNLKLMVQSNQQFKKGLSLLENDPDANLRDVLRMKLQVARTEKILGRNEAGQKLLQQIIDVTDPEPQFMDLNLHAKVDAADAERRSGAYNKAEVMLNQLLDQIPRQTKYQNTKFLALMALTVTHIEQTKFHEAEQVARAALATLGSTDSPKPTNVLAANNNLALVLNHLGRWSDAEEILVQSMQLAEQYFGKDNHGYLIMLINLGGNLQRQGKLDEALVYQERAAELVTQLEGAESEDAIKTHINLANTYVSLGRMIEGEDLMRTAYQNANEKMGNDHIETLKLAYNLGELLNNTSRYEESLLISDESLPVALEGLGERHLITLLLQDNIAVSHMGLNQVTLGLPVWENALAGLVAQFGRNNPYFILVKGHQVDGLIQAGQDQSAVLAQKALIQAQIDFLGQDHAEVARAETKLQQMLEAIDGQEHLLD